MEAEGGCEKEVDSRTTLVGAIFEGLKILLRKKRNVT